MSHPSVSLCPWHTPGLMTTCRTAEFALSRSAGPWLRAGTAGLGQDRGPAWRQHHVPHMKAGFL